MLGLFLDLSKAFDTLDHSILVNKLRTYGIRGVLVDWCISYLLDRKQYVVINDSKSEMRQIRCGVPQGSILGPLLFLVYMNDLCNISERLNFIQFADDTSVFMTHDDPHTLMENFNQELEKLFDWLLVNKLVLNVNKTKYMVFTKRNVAHDFNVKIGNQDIERASSLKFLAVTIDGGLSWHEHIGVVCNTVSKSIGVINKLNKLPQSILKLLYNAIILPHLNYCNITWANSNDYSRLFLLQKKAVRIISHPSYFAHTKPIFEHFKILNFFGLNNYNIAICMYLCFRNKIPDRLCSYFSFNLDYHDYNTRSASNYHLPKVRTMVSKHSIFYKGPVIWNNLTLEIRPTLQVQLQYF